MDSQSITRKKETVAGRCLDPEYREGFVRGYTECAHELLHLVENIVTDEAEIADLRERFADYIYGVARMIERDVLSHPGCEHREEEGEWQVVR